MKVLHVLDHSVPLHSGYSFRTLSILREQRKLGWQTLQVTTPKQGRTEQTRETVDGFDFIRTPGTAEQNLVAQMIATGRQVARAIREFGPDVVHAHSPILTALPSLYAARRARLPLVYEVRATWEDAAVDHGSTQAGSARYRVSKALETFVVRQADHVTTICEGLRRELAGRGVPASKITVIPNAVDLERFSFGNPRNREIQGRLGIGDAAVVGFIGSFYGYEGLDLLLEAVALLAADEVDVHAVLVGGGPEEANLKAKAEALGVTDRVHFIGRVGHDEVQAWYDAIDVLVYPRRKTRLTDTVTPLKPLEAMAQGKIVVASDVGGHQEMVRDDDTGLFFLADDPEALAARLRGALADPSGWPAMRERALKFVRDERNWRRSVAGYVGAYRDALTSAKRAVPEQIRP